MTIDEAPDLLSDEDATHILIDVMKSAGSQGIEKVEMERLFNVAADEIRDMVLAKVMYESWAEGKMRLSVDGDEVHWHLAAGA